MKKKCTLKETIAAILFLAALLIPQLCHAEKLRDLADVAGARENQLVGYGVVSGLNGTGDDQSAPMAAQSTIAMLRKMGVQIDPAQVRLRNVAAVVVTATLPAFAKPGSKIDITVSSIGNAKSLSGGVLVQTLLKGADQKTYAVGQGAMTIGGFDAKGKSGSSASQGTQTTARITEGAIVEKDVQTNIVSNGTLKLGLRTPSFTVAARVAEAVNKKFEGAASATDGGGVDVKVPAEYEKKLVELVASLEDIEVTPVRRGRVIINERTGTIVAGGDVRIAPAAVVHGSITITVKETPQVSQPEAPFGKTGTTKVVTQSDVKVQEAKPGVTYMKGEATLSDVASALSTLGLSPRELGSVLQAMRSAGALEAEVVIQ